MPKILLDHSAVVRVGDGRGFIVSDGVDRFVITAGHCLPFIPSPHGFSYPEERTYSDLIGLLGENPDVWAECLFIDPISDLAILGTPDSQSLFDQADKYTGFVDATKPLSIADTSAKGQGFLLSLDFEFFACDLEHFGGAWIISEATKGIVAGMSGSPIVTSDGSAVGVVCLSSSDSENDTPTRGGPNPRLFHNLPAWFLRKIGLVQ